MKKLLVLGIALIAAAMFVMPASATELTLGGYYRVEGRYQDNPNLDEDYDAGGAAWRHRFRFTPAFIVSDALRFDAKMDIFDGTRFGTLGATEKAGNNIDFDRAWMTIKTSFGAFAVGRMAGGAWGLDFLNDNEDYDRARFDTKFGNVSTGIILQKNLEQDWGGNGTVDADVDVYYLYGVYRANFGAMGLLGAYVNNKANPVVDTTAYNLLPYFDLKFGGLGVRGELKWATGEMDPDAVGAATTDTEELAWTLQADYTLGAFKFGGGYAFVQGEDADPLTQTVSNKGYGGLGDDWGLFLVATDVDQVVNTNAFGVLDTGVSMWYVDAQWKATKAWTFTARVGGFKADEVAAGRDDEIGMEYDLDASWAVMKNLKWSFSGGYFDTGDYFKGQGYTDGNGIARIITNQDNTYTLRQQLTLSF